MLQNVHKAGDDQLPAFVEPLSERVSVLLGALLTVSVVFVKCVLLQCL